MTRHGTLTAYVHGKCRCDECAQHQYRHMKGYRMRVQRGEPRLVDATAMREHVEALRDAGMSDVAITRAAGWSSRNALAQALTSKRVTPATEARLLAVRPEHDTRPTSYVDPTSTVERLRDLALLGWTLRGLASDLGMDMGTVRRIIAGTRPRIRRSTAAAVFTAWREMGAAPGPSMRTRAWAARQPWSAEPSTVEACSRCEDIEWLRLMGESRDEIARRVGMTLVAMGRHLSRHGRRDLW